MTKLGEDIRGLQGNSSPGELATFSPEAGTERLFESAEELPVGRRTLEIHRSRRLRGALSFPGDAYASMLTVGIAALCGEATRIENLPEAPWIQEFRSALELWGASFEPLSDHQNHWLVRGGALHPASEPIVVRHEMAALILAGIGSGAELQPELRLEGGGISSDVRALLHALYPNSGGGDEDALFRPRELHRKAQHICKPFESHWDDGLAKIPLLFHHLASRQGLELHLRRLGSDLLENLLRQFEVDVKIERDDDKDADELTRRIARQLRAAGKQEPVTRVRLPAGAKPKAAFISLPGDVGETSVAALAAVLIKGSDLLLENVLLNTGRSGFVAALRRMGADIEVVQRKERHGETVGTLRVRSSDLFGKRFDADTLADLRDEVFLLLLAAAFAEGESVFRDLEYLRQGRVDWLKEFIVALKRSGVEIGEFEDGLVIRGKPEYDGGVYDSLGHTGLAAAYAVLALKSHGTSTLTGCEALHRRFPDLLQRLDALTAVEKNA